MLQTQKRDANCYVIVACTGDINVYMAIRIKGRYNMLELVTHMYIADTHIY